MKSIKQPSILLIYLIMLSGIAVSAEDVPLYTVYELTFKGMSYTLKDNPVRDISLVTTWQHETSRQTIEIYGFYDSDGKGGKEGNCFKVRFCPTSIGKWTLTKTLSNDRNLNGQQQGIQVNAISSDHPGFWIPDNESPGKNKYVLQVSEHLDPYL